MALVHDRCICLRKLDYSETSQIMLLIGREHGLARVIAKGMHRTTKAGASKFGGGIDLLDVADGVFTFHAERELSTLTDWKLQEGHPLLRASLRGLYLGFYAAELVSHLIEENDPHPQLFDGLERTLLELGTPRAEEAFLGFELSLLRETGYVPELGGCVSCGLRFGGREPVFFSPARGGTVCRGCEGGFPDRLVMEPRLVSMLQYFIRLSESEAAGRLPRLTRAQTDPINRLMADHIQHTLGRRLRLPRYVLPLAKPTLVGAGV